MWLLLSISLLEFSEVVDPKIASSLLAMFLAFYCNLDKDVNKEQQVDGILQTLISQSKDHKGNLASITTGILYIQRFFRTYKREMMVALVSYKHLCEEYLLFENAVAIVKNIICDCLSSKPFHKHTLATIKWSSYNYSC